MRSYFTLLLVLFFTITSHGAITPIALSDGTEGKYFKVQFKSDKVSNNKNVRWKVIGAPPGIVIDNVGNYAGTPTKSGNYSVTVYVHLTSNTGLILKDTFTIPHSIKSSPPLSISGPLNLPPGQFDKIYSSYSLQATGGVPVSSGGYIWEPIVIGSSEFENIPKGMLLSKSGVLSGVPTSKAPVPQASKTYTFRAKATDSVGKSAIGNYTLVVNPALPPVIIAKCPLPDGIEKIKYKDFKITGSGGKPPYYWTIKPPQDFPAGLKIDYQTGVISGTPTTFGNFTFQINLVDQNGFSVNKSCSISIQSIPRITTNSIVEWDCAKPGIELPCVTITASGGNTPYKWEIKPPVDNLTITPLPPNQAKICGSFTSSGLKVISIKVSDNKTSTFSTTIFTVPVYSLKIDTICPLENGVQGQELSRSFKASGGKLPYKWEILPQIYVADANNNRIRKFNEDGIITTYAGGGSNSQDDTPALEANIPKPYGLAFDPFGNIYAACETIHSIKKITFDGKVSTLLDQNDGLKTLEDASIDDEGNVYVANNYGFNLLKFDSNGNLKWDTGPIFDRPQGICFDLDGNILMCDYNNKKVVRYSTDGSFIEAFTFPIAPHDVKIDRQGNIYICGSSIYKVDLNKVISLYSPEPLFCFSIDSNGNIYGSLSNTVKKILPDKTVKTIAGTGSAGFSDNTNSLLAMFNDPRGVEINPYEDLPLGLTLNETTGEISGTPEAHGLYNLTYKVTDSCGNFAISNCTLTIQNNKPEFDFELPWKFTDTGALASGHNGALRNYTSNTMPAGALWSVESDNLTLKVSWENSSGCPSGSNPNTQSATATINMTTSKAQKISIEWDGIGELEAANFEKMEVYIDGNLIGSAQAAGGNQGCAMGPVTSVNNYPSGYELPAGNHVISINATTNDGAYHTGAYYQFRFTLVE